MFYLPYNTVTEEVSCAITYYATRISPFEICPSSRLHTFEIPGEPIESDVAGVDSVGTALVVLDADLLAFKVLALVVSVQTLGDGASVILDNATGKDT